MPKRTASRITALVVDDEELDRAAMAEALRAEGYKVLEAESFSDAMAVFEKHGRDIRFLLADVSLPDENGCSLALKLRELKPNLRVLFVSFHVGAEICKQYGVEMPDLHFLKKPLDPARLTARVRQILESSEAFPRLALPKTLSSSGD